MCIRVLDVLKGVARIADDGSFIDHYRQLSAQQPAINFDFPMSIKQELKLYEIAM